MTRVRPSGGSAGRARAGFTLIELLVALTLLGLVSVVLFGGLRFGTRAWEAGNARAERLAEIETVQSLLRRQLAQAVQPGTLAGRSEAGEGGAPFVGGANALRFVALAPLRIGVAGFYLFDLAVIEDSRSARLELTWRLFRPDEPDTLAEPEPGLGGRRVLIEGIERAAFSYYGAERGEQEARWRERWDEAAGLPSLIALDIAFPRDDPRPWPRLVVAPRLARTTPGA